MQKINIEKSYSKQKSLLDFKSKCYMFLILKNKNNFKRILDRNLNKITKYNNLNEKNLSEQYKKL